MKSASGIVATQPSRSGCGSAVSMAPAVRSPVSVARRATFSAWASGADALAEPRYFELMFLVPRPGVPLAPDSLRATPAPSFGAVIAALQESMAAADLIAGDRARSF